MTLLTVRTRQGAGTQSMSAGRSPGALQNCEAAKGSGVNFPLSSYSAFRKKNVSQKKTKTKTFLVTRMSYGRASLRNFASSRLLFCRRALEEAARDSSMLSV